MTSRVWRGVVVVVLVVASACRDATEPAFPFNASPFTALPPYATWWKLVEACSGRRGDFTAVQWFRTPDLPGLIVDGSPYAGYWFSVGNRIVLEHHYSFDGGTVRHEMLHSLLQSGAHPRAYFVDRCDALTPCEKDCGLREDARGVPSGAREVLPSALRVTSRVDPAEPSVAVDSGWFRLTISATNPSSEPVWVKLADEETFSYVEEQRPGTYRLTSELRWAFRAYETRRYIFDLKYPAGSYVLFTSFSTNHGPPLAVTVRP